MSNTTAIAIYFLIWWVSLFVVLPFGIRSQHEGESFEPGTDPGAPQLARIAWKLLWTTVVATVIFAICWVLYTNRLITLDSFPFLPNRNLTPR